MRGVTLVTPRRARVRTGGIRVRAMSRGWIVGLFLVFTACSPGTQPDAGDAATDARADRARPDVTDPSDGDPVARARDFTLHARGLDAQEGRGLSAWVVESTGFHEMAFASVAAVAGGEAEIRLPDLLPEGDYHVDVFVDANGNGRYDGPGTDPSWRVTVPNIGSATVAMTASDAVTDIATPPRESRADFAMTLGGIAPDEYGQRLELRVIDAASHATVGGFVHPRLPAAATLSVQLPGILEEGGTYTVDFWIDADASGTYSGPGADHTWRETVTATASGATVNWTRSDDYVELDWR
jgi:hypothetical protein